MIEQFKLIVMAAALGVVVFWLLDLVASNKK